MRHAITNRRSARAARATPALLLLLAAHALPMVPARAAEPTPLEAARSLADRIGEQTRTAPGAAQAGEPLPKVDPCSLLTTADVHQVYPKASAGERERTREKYGIVACVWNHPAGKLVTQVTLGATRGSSADEAKGLAIGFVDPLKPGAEKALRTETLPGIGDEAVAVVEKEDSARGILAPAAYLYTQRGDRQLAIFAVDLANGDRTAALDTLGRLGRLAAGRL